MLCNITLVPFHESDKHIFAKIPAGVRTPVPLLWLRPCTVWTSTESEDPEYNKHSLYSLYTATKGQVSPPK